MRHYRRVLALPAEMDAYIARSAFLGAGGLEGFALFSSFSLEALQSAQKRRWITARVYLVSSRLPLAATVQPSII